MPLTKAMLQILDHLDEAVFAFAPQAHDWRACYANPAGYAWLEVDDLAGVDASEVGQKVRLGVTGHFADVALHDRVVDMDIDVLDDLVVARLRDVGDRRAAEDRAAEAERSLRVALDAMLDGVAVYRAVRDDRGEPIDFVTEYINPSGAILAPAEEQIGRRLTELFPHLAVPGALDPYLEVVRSQQSFHRVVELGGRTVELFASPMRDGYVLSFHDLTDLVETDARARQVETRYRLAAEGGHLGTWFVNLDDGSFELDELARIQFGLDPQSPGDLLDAVHPDDRVGAFAAMVDLVEGSGAIDIEHRLVRGDGSVAWVRVQGARRTPSEFHGVVQDITESRAVQEALRVTDERLRSITSHVSDVIFRVRVHPETRVEFVNQACTAVTGFTPDDYERDAELVFRLIDHDIEAALRHPGPPGTTEVGPIEMAWRHRDGSTRFVELQATLVRDADGVLQVIDGVARDATAEREYLERLAAHGLHDTLTGLPGRILFAEQLAAMISRLDRRRGVLAVTVVGFTGLPELVDSLGHDAGDELLLEVGRRLSTAVRQGDLVARISGDEFAVVFDEMPDATTALERCDHLLRLVGAPIEVDGAETFTTVAGGVALASMSTDRAGDVIREATAAMHRGRMLGRPREVFDERLRASVERRHRTAAALRRAITNGELVVHYQPEVDLATGALLSVEALVRWEHPSDGLVPPGAFIPIAEETGLILPLGRAVLEMACTQGAQWVADGTPLTVRVNLSPHQLAQPDIDAEVAAVLRDTGFPAELLCLEVTETAMMTDVDAAAQRLRSLVALGAHIALDDFGTGWSSLAHLKRFPIDVLKIDQSFTANVVDDPDDRAIVTATVLIARSLGMTVTAEGVETAEQAAALVELGCLRAQGYWLGRPVPAGEVVPAAPRRVVRAR